MALDDATREAVTRMITDRGRFVDGRWYGATNEMTHNCYNHTHGICTGWIFPLGGEHKCMCPCHDTHRNPYPVALAQSTKAANYWRAGDRVTIPEHENPAIIRNVNHTDGTAFVKIGHREFRYVRFADLNLCVD